MKILITIWILSGFSVFAQSDCDDFKVLLKEVNKNYSELSQNPVPNYIKFILTQNDSLKTRLYKDKGELVYQNNFGFVEEGVYIIKYFNPECSGVYFLSLEIGNKPGLLRAIQITYDSFPANEVETDTTSSVIDGVWKRSYSEKIIPAIQYQSELHKIEYHYKYDLQLHFSKGMYKIISERTDEESNGKNIKTFEGRYILKGDTLKLYEDSNFKKLFQFKIAQDTLSVSYFQSIDKVTGAISIPFNSYNMEIKLIGVYHK